MDWSKSKLSRRKFIRLASGAVVGISAFGIMGCSKGSVEQMTSSQNSSGEASSDYTPVFPRHEAYGKGIGAKPGRVAWTHDANSVKWDGSGYWWDLSHFDYCEPHTCDFNHELGEQNSQRI